MFENTMKCKAVTDIDAIVPRIYEHSCGQPICSDLRDIWNVLVTATATNPADTLRNNDVVIMSKRRHFDVVTSK